MLKSDEQLEANFEGFESPEIPEGDASANSEDTDSITKMMNIKHQCILCDRSFFKDFIVSIAAPTVVCLLCDLRRMANNEINVLRDHLQKEKIDRTAETEALRIEIVQLKAKFSSAEKKRSINNIGNSYANALKGNCDAVNKACIANISQTDDEHLHQHYGQEFQLVKNGSRPKKSPLYTSPIRTYNSFDVLQENDPDQSSPVECVLVGDSMFRNQKRYFHNHSKCKVRSYSGHSLTGSKLLISKTDDFTKSSDKDTVFVIEIGTNDLLSPKEYITPDEVIEKYRALLVTLREKSKSNNMIILGLLPVLFETLDDITDRKYINERLAHLAEEENVQFLSLWSEFAHSPTYWQYFNKGGLHLSASGDALLASLLNAAVKNFHTERSAHHQS